MRTAQKVIFIIIIWCVGISAGTAQTVKVKSGSSWISGHDSDGYQVELAGGVDDVRVSLQKFLKAYGKVKQNNDMLELTESRFNSSSPKIPIYAIAKQEGTNSLAWLGIKSAEWPENEQDGVKKELEKLIYEFGVKYHKDKIQLQIDESNQAYKAVEKQQQKLVNENQSLNSKLTFNEKEKIRLEQALEKNKADHEALLQKIEANKHSQDSVVMVGDQIQKVTEGHKKRQDAVK